MNQLSLNKEVSWISGNSNAYYLTNDLKIFLAFNKDNQITVGDSIYKEANTFIYDVYRKDENDQYEYKGTYDFNDVY